MRSRKNQLPQAPFGMNSDERGLGQYFVPIAIFNVIKKSPTSFQRLDFAKLKIKNYVSESNLHFSA